MPVAVRHIGTVKSKPWAIVEVSTGRIVGRSKTKRKANRAAGIRNAAYRRKHKT